MLFDNAVIDVLDDFSPLWSAGATFYPGDEFTYTFENGSTLKDEWWAVYFDPGPTGPLETGGDYYNFFVLGLYPASFNTSDQVAQPTNINSAPAPAPTSLNNTAFPEHPDVAQQNLTVDGWVTGYFLHEQSLAVLSIPTFYADGAAIEDFARTVGDFLTEAKAAGLSKVVIDLQQNEGGDLILAYSTFRQFFPSIEPFAGSIMRTSPLANLMGTEITNYWHTMNDTDSGYSAASADEWIATTRINAATGRNFSSWQELYGPYDDGVDAITATIQLNTSDYLYDYSALGQEDPPSVLLTRFAGDAPYAPEDIIMVRRSVQSHL